MVPGTAHRILDHQAFAERATVVGAGRADREYLLAFPGKEDRLVPDPADQHRAIVEIAFRYAAAEIRQALIGDETLTNRLSMWARRLVGEALSQAQRVAAERPAFTDLLANVPDAGGDVAAMLRRLTNAHTERMAAIGLNN